MKKVPEIVNAYLNRENSFYSSLAEDRFKRDMLYALRNFAGNYNAFAYADECKEKESYRWIKDDFYDTKNFAYFRNTFCEVFNFILYLTKQKVLRKEDGYKMLYRLRCIYNDFSCTYPHRMIDGVVGSIVMDDFINSLYHMDADDETIGMVLGAAMHFVGFYLVMVEKRPKRK